MPVQVNWFAIMVDVNYAPKIQYGGSKPEVEIS
jgi:hypothetical protein